MKANIITIGNSKGIKIPKTILKQCNIKENDFIEIENENIIIKHIKKKAREKWESFFKKMNQNKDDQLIISDNIDLRIEDWEW